MSTAMTAAARQQFLADRHVGVLSVVTEHPGTTPTTATLAVPIWYDYSPETGVSVITSPTSAKAVALEAAGRFALVAQTEDIPYRYVAVEGPITDIRRCDPESDLLPMAIRYLGTDLGTTYAEQTGADVNTVYVMQPEHWWSTDLTEAFDTLRGVTSHDVTSSSANQEAV